MTSMRPQTKNVERDKQVRWLRRLRERTQHYSLAFRPRMVRMMWMKYSHKEDASILIKGIS